MPANTRSLPRILIVDDDSPVRDLLTEGLTDGSYDCAAAADGVAALDALRRQRFELLITDVDMPGMDGLTLLTESRKIAPDTEVILLTGVVDVDVAIRAMRCGACDYLTKPFNLAEMKITVERALEKQRLMRENRDYQKDLETKVEERTVALRRKNREVEDLLGRLQGSYQATLEALATALDTRDSETLGHSRRVASYTIAVARRLGVQEPDLTDIYRGALLHDVGKIGVPDAILRKPARLTDDEWAEMRKHPEAGYRILEGVPFLEEARRIVLSHQERYDGRGYPRGLKGKEIPIGARIFTVVDTLDAMTSDRPYRRAVPFDAARAELLRHSGTQFDPEVVRMVVAIPDEEWSAIHQQVLRDIMAREGKAA
jgi:putative nucleotidyltransferase with HDIG domain